MRRARRGPGRRRPRPVAQLLRPRPHAAPRARLLRRRRRAARPVPGRGPPPAGHRAVHHPVQRPRARRRRRRAHGPPPEGRGRRAGPVARHPHERPRRRPPARPLGRPPPHPGRRRRPVAGRGVQAPRPVLQLRALDRVPAGAGLERVGQRPGRDQARHPRRPGLARPGPHRLGQPHPLVAVPHRPPERDDPHRVRDRRRSRGDLVGGVRHPAGAAHLRRAGRVGAGQRRRPR